MSFQKLVENEDYALVPCEDTPNDQAWSVRVLKGDYTETVIRYGNLKFSGVDEDEPNLHFNFEIDSSPLADLNEEDGELQKFAGDLLLSIIEDAIEQDTLLMGEPKVED